MKDEQINLKFFDPMTHLFVKDVNVSIRFYIDNFGFIETFRDKKSGSPDHVELKLDQFQLAISSISAARNIHGLDVGGNLPKGELLFWTDNVDEVYKTLIRRGVKGIKEPHDFRTKLRPAWITDPDNNLIQIVTEKRE